MLALTETTRTLQKSATSFLWKLMGGRRYVIETTLTCPDIASRCGQQLQLKQGDQEEAIAAIDRFKDDMLAIELVEAVAFLASQASPAPVTLQIVVFMPLMKENDLHIDAFETVSRAGAVLHRDLTPIMPSGLKFVNTVNKGLDAQERKHVKKWKKDLTLDLLAFVEIERS